MSLNLENLLSEKSSSKGGLALQLSSHAFADRHGGDAESGLHDVSDDHDGKV